MSQNNICVVRIFSVPPIFGLYDGDFSLQPNRSERDEHSIEIVVAGSLNAVYEVNKHQVGGWVDFIEQSL